MWGTTHSQEMWRRRLEQEGYINTLHNTAPPEQPQEQSPSQQPGPIQQEEQQERNRSDSTVVSDASTSEDEDGTWGEHDVGGPVSARRAMQGYAELQREMSRRSIQTQRSRPESLKRGESAFRTLSRRITSRRGVPPAQHERDEESVLTDEETTDAAAVAEEEKEEEQFELGQFIEEGHFERRKEGRSAKKVGVIFKHLTVKGVGAQTSFVRTLPDAIVGTFGPDLYHIITRFVPSLRLGRKPQTRDLIHDFTGLVRDGEMMLVLGRPGAGCSTFLKAISNDTEGFAAVEGEISYGGISAKEQKKHYRGEVNYNPEDDQHMPNLTVYQTLEFALLNKTKKSARKEVPIIIDALLRMFGISHTAHTLVGNEYVRGVSGGERKRVSIAETLATKSTVVCWDNSTRGLDASTALDYANSLRVMTDVSHRTTLVTLYQAGEGIYELMDKVLVIEEGRMIFQGPAKEAKQYFIDLGFHCPDRQTTADFLTSVCDPVARQFREGCEASTPRTAAELEQAFRQSPHYKLLLQSVEAYERELHESDHADAREFKQSVRESKSKTVPKKSSYTISFPRQVLATTKREFWLIWGDKITLKTKFFIIISNALIVGSLFYGQSGNTSSAFSRGGTLFFSIVFLGWLQLTELMKAVSGRVIIARHKEYAFYRPSAVVIARVLTDFPMIFLQVAVFVVIMYFLTDLDVNVSKFWIYSLFVYTNTLCITALYRMFAALSPTIDDAVRFSGTALNLLVVYTGYVIPKTQLLNNYIWFGWINYVNPIGYSFEAVVSNEFAGRVMPCAPDEIVPSGPGYTDSRYQGCAIAGSSVGSLDVTGESYLSTSFSYTRAHLWRDFGIVIAFAVFYIVVTALATEFFSFVSSGGGALIFKRSKKAKQLVKQSPPDEEKGGESSASSADNKAEDDALGEITKSQSIFTWQDVEYTVPYQGGQRKLLNKVSGYAKPGVMVALMGASGAGKTTLLNILAQRIKTGVITGDFQVDGRPLGTEFQRGTGFCEQMDLHDGTQTIREALEFSAILRQERTVPREEKVAYVDKIIDLLELGDLQDAIVSSLGVEQRKRLTIGVELAAKPNLLLFLDEPTSGLDSQSAYSIVRFLKKLAHAGQAIICTIHQPSSVLIQQFDMILALNPGGNTFYFGPVGDNGKDVIKYFGDRGVQCPPRKNVAEFILETAAKRPKGPDGKRIDWNKEWINSEDYRQLIQEISNIKAERNKLPAPQPDQEHEFASPVWLQTTMLTKRLFINYWRDPSYLYGKLFVSVITGIFNGFTFWQLGNSVQDMQNRMFTVFLIIMIPPTIVNAVVPKFYQNRSLWEARELPSRIYGWVAFCTANVVCEIPIAIVGAFLYWVLWYWPTGLPTDSSTSGHAFLMCMLFFLFQASWGQWICAFAPSFTVISNCLPFFFVIFGLFNGVVRPYSQLNVFWKYFVYYLNPSTYWIGSVLASTLHNQPVTCTSSETAHFNPPPGQTCQSYAGNFVIQAGQGYLVNPGATSDCQYCPYTVGDDYLSTLNISAKDKWGYFGCFLAFVISNWVLVYFFIYTVRIKGWSFGLGTLSSAVDKLVGAVSKKIKSVAGGKRKEQGEKKA